MNLINGKALDQELDQISSGIIDPKLEVWFKKVVRYWVFNLDKLNQPYHAQAEPRSKRVGGRPSDFYVNPGPGPLYDPSQAPKDKSGVCPVCKGQKGVYTDDKWTACKYCNGTGAYEVPYGGGSKCELCKGKGRVKKQNGLTIPADTDDPDSKECPACKGIGSKETCRACNGRGHKGATNEPCDVCKGSGIRPVKSAIGSEGFHIGDSKVVDLVNSILNEVNDNYDPADRTYATALNTGGNECETCRAIGKIDPDCPYCHGTGIIDADTARDIKANFNKFDPSQAKDSRFYGEAPTKSELEPWMKGNDYQFFDPIRTSDRYLFELLNNLVHYLNFIHDNLELPDETHTEIYGEIDDVKDLRKRIEARKLQAKSAYKKIEQSLAHPNDIDVFKSIMSDCYDWIDKIHNNYVFSLVNGFRTLKREGSFVLKQCLSVDAVLKGASVPWLVMPRETKHEWCLNRPYSANDYFNHGTIYYVEKDGMAYFSIYVSAKDSRYFNQCKLPNNEVLDKVPDIEKEVAPFLVDTNFEPEDFKPDAKNLGDMIQAMRLA
jgi:hypothetical protein